MSSPMSGCESSARPTHISNQAVTMLSRPFAAYLYAPDIKGVQCRKAGGARVAGGLGPLCSTQLNLSKCYLYAPDIKVVPCTAC